MSQSLDRHQRARALFEQVRQQQPAAWAAALAAACSGDAELHQEVAGLLEAAAQAGSLLDHGAAPALAKAEGLVGRRLGPYEIQGIIGAGGMGEVYRARDTKLGRDVALKFLPEHFAADPDRVARFQREAQVLASLNDPHIAAIYGLEESNGVRALVLELVEGPTLADRIAQGPIPLDEAVPIARQLAEALGAAHEQGIIHRDLKPANIKLRSDGTVKVLDFGLAKVLEPESVSASLTESPTMTSPAMTRMGVILGTAPYMSPEQAKGRSVDKRSDIWAYGCVLFEMLTGHRAFSGEEVSDTLAAILTKEPDWTWLPPGTPLPVHRLLRRCLEKDRTRRLADIADARLDLDERVTDAMSSATSVPQSPKSVTLRRWLPWSIAAAGVATTLWLAGLRVLDRPAAGTEVYRSSILLPGRLGSYFGPALALSPDGRRLAFVASDTTGRGQLWIRMLDGLAAQPLADTADAQSPFWSPDSRWLAFVQDDRLKKIEAAGGQAITLCDAADAGGTWNRDGVILFPQRTGALARVPAAGGTPSPLTRTDSNVAEVFSSSPFFLPDGRHFLYAETTFSGQTGVYVASLGAPDQRVLLPLDATAVQYAQGFLWFLRGSTLMAQPFDADRHALAGQAVPIAEQVRVDSSWLRTGAFSVSAAGSLVFQTDPSPGNELVWYDREGRPTGKLGTPAEYADPIVSPDGRRLLVSVVAAGTRNPDLWVFDVARGLRTRFTFDDVRPMGGAIWSPDGGRIAFASRRKGHVALLQRASSGAGGDEVLLEDEFEKEINSWSPDGRFILYARRSGGEPSPWVLPLEGDRKPFASAQANAFYSLVSPDGRWVLYMSTKSGRWEVYVAPFPGPGGAWQVSTAGGLDPHWRADGKEIFYLGFGPNSKLILMSAAVTLLRDRVEVGEVKPLFELTKVGPRGTYDVSPDGKRIVAVTQPAQATSDPLTLIVNWPALLKKMRP